MDFTRTPWVFTERRRRNSSSRCAAPVPRSQAVLAAPTDPLPLPSIHHGSSLRLGLDLLSGERNLCPQLPLEEFRRFSANATENHGYCEGQECRDQEEDAKTYTHPGPSTHACAPFGVSFTGPPPFGGEPQTPLSLAHIIRWTGEDVKREPLGSPPGPPIVAAEPERLLRSGSA
jgi:hypothetical protein